MPPISAGQASANRKPYTQKFSNKWLCDPRLKDWIEKTSVETKARCRYCKCLMTTRLSDLLDHIKTKKHQGTTQPFSPERQRTQPTLPFKQVAFDANTSSAEAALATFVVCHSAIMSVDHLTDLSTCVSRGPKFVDEIQLHRTKCSSIVRNVLYPHFKQCLREDIGNGFYSVLVDEMTDIAVTKQLGVCVIYFSKSKRDVVSCLLKIAVICGGTAVDIVNGLKDILCDFGLDIQKMRGIGSDNASVMAGRENGVFAVLKREVKHLIHIRCVCHSVQLAVSAAAKNELRKHLEFLLAETYNWFARSSLRQSSYKELFKIIFDGNGEEKKTKDPLKIVQVAATRWLSIEVAVDRVLDQWDALKLHFELSKDSEKCYATETLFKMYNDVNNHVFLTFLRPVLRECQHVNKAFQSDTADPAKLLNDLVLLVQTIAKLVVNPGFRGDVLSADLKSHLHPRPYLGVEFETLVGILRRSKLMSVDTEIGIREVCIKFVIRLHSELRDRLPENIETLKNVSFITPDNCLKQMKPSIVNLARLMLLEESEISNIEFQWHKLSLVDWERKSNTTAFWAEVLQYKDSSGAAVFQELANFDLLLLVLPWSNAEIERAFSQVSIVKNRHRNRMLNLMVNAILTIRSGLRREGKCCHQIQYPVAVLKKIGTWAIYDTATKKDGGSLIKNAGEGSSVEGETSFNVNDMEEQVLLFTSENESDPDDPCSVIT